MKKILLVEDDIILGETIADILEDEEFEISWVKNGQAALDATFIQQFDLFLFDVNVPFINGFELLSELRKSGDNTPTIFITARVDIASLSYGFDVGADDYVKKPFDMDELLIRIRSLIKKSFKSYSTQVSYKDLIFNVEEETLFKNDQEIFLPPMEFKLFKIFMRDLGKTLAKESILNELNEYKETSEGALRVHISSLKKLGLEIINIRGVGYRCEQN